MAFVTKEKLDKMADEFCKENHVGEVEESAAYKDLEAKLKEVQQLIEDQRAESQPRQMMGCDDVVAALGVSRSTAYKIIKRLNGELEKDGYITVRGRISKAYFEERTYGISVDAG